MVKPAIFWAGDGGGGGGGGEGSGGFGQRAPVGRRGGGESWGDLHEGDLALLGDVDLDMDELPVLAGDVDDVGAGVDRDGGVPLGLADGGAVAADGEAGDGASDGVGDLDGEAGKAGPQGLGALVRELLPVLLAGGPRGVRDLEVGAPRARELAGVLQAVGQVELGADRGIEALALGELGAGLGELAGGGERAGVVEEGLGRGLLLALARPLGAGGGGEEEQHGDGAGAGQLRLPPKGSALGLGFTGVTALGGGAPWVGGRAATGGRTSGRSLRL